MYGTQNYHCPLQLAWPAAVGKITAVNWVVDGNACVKFNPATMKINTQQLSENWQTQSKLIGFHVLFKQRECSFIGKKKKVFEFRLPLCSPFQSREAGSCSHHHSILTLSSKVRAKWTISDGCIPWYPTSLTVSMPCCKTRRILCCCSLEEPYANFGSKTGTKDVIWPLKHHLISAHCNVAVSLSLSLSLSLYLARFFDSMYAVFHHSACSSVHRGGTPKHTGSRRGAKFEAWQCTPTNCRAVHCTTAYRKALKIYRCIYSSLESTDHLCLIKLDRWSSIKQRMSNKELHWWTTFAQVCSLH